MVHSGCGVRAQRGHILGSSETQEGRENDSPVHTEKLCHESLISPVVSTGGAALTAGGCRDPEPTPAVRCAVTMRRNMTLSFEFRRTM